METYNFTTNINDLLNIISKLYKTDDIFIREIISNSSDALSNQNNPEIKIILNDDNNTITFTDNGIGMDKNDLINKLSNIAYTDKNKNNIGQFGVGFFSSFIVGYKVVVLSRKDDIGYEWSSDGYSYSIKEKEDIEKGTSVIIYLKDDKLKYLNVIEFEDIVEKYLLFIKYPIYIKNENEWKLLNDINLELNNKNDYTNFYKRISNDWQEPISYCDYKKDNIRLLLFIPELIPYNLFQNDKQFNNIKLYINGIYLDDNILDLVPSFLHFMIGIIDIKTDKIMVSRDGLLDGDRIDMLRDLIYEQSINLFYELLNDRIKYEHFYELYSTNIKMGIIDGYHILDLLLFNTNKNKMITLDDYINNMIDGQKCIFYLMGSNNIFMERLDVEDYEVLLMNKSIDEYVLLEFVYYRNYYMLDVAKDIFPKFDEDTDEYFRELCDIFYEELKDRVEEVRVSHRLYKSVCCLVSKNNGYTANMEKIVRAESLNNIELDNNKKIMELNPFSKTIQRLNELRNEDIRKYINNLYIIGLIDSGYQLENNLINDLLNNLI